MKKFKYKFTKLITALIYAGIALSVAGFGINLYYCIANGIKGAADPVYPILQYALMFLVTITLIVLLVSVLVSSCYIIDGKYFKTKFGFIISKYDVENIDTIVDNKKTGKLTVTFANGEYMVIVVKQEWYNDFIEALLAANRKIEYSIISLDKTDLDKEDKLK
ncbi:MAG: hypothetical protein ACI4MB_06100 [Candidatus Coproplasma sp.]